jgi:hypothetical protein
MEYVEEDKKTQLLTQTPLKRTRQMDKHNNNNNNKNNRSFRNSWGITSRSFVLDSSVETAETSTVAA